MSMYVGYTNPLHTFSTLIHDQAYFHLYVCTDSLILSAKSEVCIAKA